MGADMCQPSGLRYIMYIKLGKKGVYKSLLGNARPTAQTSGSVMAKPSGSWTIMGNILECSRRQCSACRLTRTAGRSGGPSRGAAASRPAKGTPFLCPKIIHNEKFMEEMLPMISNCSKEPSVPSAPTRDGRSDKWTSQWYRDKNLHWSITVSLRSRFW